MRIYLEKVRTTFDRNSLIDDPGILGERTYTITLMILLLSMIVSPYMIVALVYGSCHNLGS